MDLKDWLFPENKIGQRLIVLVIAFSSAITLVISAVQLFGEYRELRNDLDEQLEQIAVHLPSISGSVWAFDDKQIDLALQALTRMPHVVRARVATANGDKQWQAGSADSRNVVLRTYPLRYEARGKITDLATLEITASLDGIVERVVDHALSIIIGNGLKTFLVAIFMVVAIRRLVTSRLEKLARSIGNVVPAGLPQAMTSDDAGHSAPDHLDELDTVHWALENASHKLGISVGALRHLNNELEDRVHQRTVELQRANGELQAFAYSLSHDLRAPLRGIAGFSRILDKDYGERLDAEARDYLQRILAATARMDELIEDTIGLFRVSAAEFHGSTVDLTAEARRIADTLSRSEPERKVRWTVEENLRVWGDMGLLHSVMENLIGNAWKYSSKRSDAMIEVGSRQEADGTRVIFVRDNGAGFDMRHAEKLFQPFQRLHLASEYPGTGVGLATVKKIIDRHGGRIWAESIPGEGATFYFCLPEPSAAADAAASKAAGDQ